MTSNKLSPSLEASRPLRVMFAATSLPVGGAETLLANLVRTLDRYRCVPEIVCLKDRGSLGDEISREITVHHGLIRNKYDVFVIRRLRRLLRDRKIDALVTVGAGDKMFWGRLAAKLAGVPVVLSALHSTGWPDGVGRLNRLLTPITDGFIAVATSHARHLVEREHFPSEKVFLIPNGIDTDRFGFDPISRDRIRAERGITERDSVVGIVAALRPEKNHELFLRTASAVANSKPNTKFWIVGDGPQRASLEQLSNELGLNNSVSFLGSRSDVPEILSAMDLFALTSLNEASPVSILEAMACKRPVVAPQVGSICESLNHETTGLLVEDHSVEQHARAWLSILTDPDRARAMGEAARKHVVDRASLGAMTRGYEELLWKVFRSKTGSRIQFRERRVARQSRPFAAS